MISLGHAVLGLGVLLAFGAARAQPVLSRSDSLRAPQGKEPPDEAQGAKRRQNSSDASQSVFWSLT